MVDGHSLGEAVDACFGGAVGCPVFHPDDAGDRSHIDDHAPALAFHDAHAVLAAEEDAAQIDRHQAVPVVFVGLVDGGGDSDAGVVDEDVETAGFLRDPFEGVAYLIRLGDIDDGGGELGPVGRFGLGLLEAGFVDVKSVDRGSLRSKEQGDRLTDAGSGSGDDSGLVGEFHSKSPRGDRDCRWNSVWPRASPCAVGAYEESTAGGAEAAWIMMVAT